MKIISHHSYEWRNYKEPISEKLFLEHAIPALNKIPMGEGQRLVRGIPTLSEDIWILTAKIVEDEL